MSQKTVLVVDDEKDIVEMLHYNLSKEGYRVLVARNGRQALELARSNPDLILLDVMLPELDGWEVCKELKKNKETETIPVLFLTAKGSEVDEILGLELGADDYIVKPISVRKLLARVRATLRRSELDAATSVAAHSSIQIDELEINIPNYSVALKGKEIQFTKKEFETLSYLASHPGRVLTRETLLNMVWGEDVKVVDRTVDVHISKIRDKLGKYGDRIETVKGVGYRFRS